MVVNKYNKKVLNAFLLSLAYLNSVARNWLADDVGLPGYKDR